MRNHIKALSAICLLSCMALVVPVHARAARAGWQDLGTRWAVARDVRGRAVQVDDLTYPGLLGRVQIAYVSPGSLAGDGGSKSGEPWWKAVPWKAEGLKHADRGPARFVFDDIDFARATLDPALFDELTARWGNRIVPGFFKNFSFERDSVGGYRLYWEGKAGGVRTPPLRVVTLLSPKANLWRTLGYQIVQNVLGAAAGLITVPVVSQLVGTALDRFFHWSDLLTSTRREALAEMLVDPPGDFALSAYERQRAAIGILYGETRLLAAVSWLWRRPTTRWATRVAFERRQAELSRKWLGEHGVQAEPLGSGFDRDPRTGIFYLSGAGYAPMYSDGGPVKALDPLEPRRIFSRRLSVESGITAAVFAGGWIPWVGNLAALQLKALLEYPEDDLRAWETRLIVRLDDRASRLRESWDSEIDQLLAQQLNPMEASRSRMRWLVDTRRSELSRSRSRPD